VRDRSTADLHIRLPPKELRAWKAAARRERETLTEWMRAKLNLAAVPPPPVPPVVSGDQLQLPRVK
jgi:hypothetical protein